MVTYIHIYTRTYMYTVFKNTFIFMYILYTQKFLETNWRNVKCTYNWLCCKNIRTVDTQIFKCTSTSQICAFTCGCAVKYFYGTFYRDEHYHCIHIHVMQNVFDYLNCKLLYVHYSEANIVTAIQWRCGSGTTDDI